MFEVCFKSVGALIGVALDYKAFVTLLEVRRFMKAKASVLQR